MSPDDSPAEARAVALAKAEGVSGWWNDDWSLAKFAELVEEQTIQRCATEVERIADNLAGVRVSGIVHGNLRALPRLYGSPTTPEEGR